jgi:hypothetical protein
VERTLKARKRVDDTPLSFKAGSGLRAAPVLRTAKKEPAAPAADLSERPVISLDDDLGALGSLSLPPMLGVGDPLAPPPFATEDKTDAGTSGKDRAGTSLGPAKGAPPPRPFATSSGPIVGAPEPAKAPEGPFEVGEIPDDREDLLKFAQMIVDKYPTERRAREAVPRTRAAVKLSSTSIFIYFFYNFYTIVFFFYFIETSHIPFPLPSNNSSHFTLQSEAGSWRGPKSTVGRSRPRLRKRST